MYVGHPVMNQTGFQSIKGNGLFYSWLIFKDFFSLRNYSKSGKSKFKNTKAAEGLLFFIFSPQISKLSSNLCA